MDYNVVLKQIRESVILKKIPRDAMGFVFSQIAGNFAKDSKNNDLIFIAKNDNEMNLIHEQLHFFSPDITQQFEILNFPAWDCLPYDRSSPKPIISSLRLKTLYRLSTRNSSQKFIIITSLNAVMQKTLASENVKNYGLFLKVGSKISLPEIVEFLIAKGYNRNDCANNVGEFAIRGGIIDIVLQKAFDLIGYRLDFFGNELDQIKTFDPITQLSLEVVKNIEILPTSEVILQQKTIENFRKNYRSNFGNSLEDHMYQAITEGRSFQGMEHWLPFFYENQLVSIFDYLNLPCCFFDDELILQSQERHDLIAKYYQNRLEEKSMKESAIYNAIDPQLLFFNPSEFKQFLTNSITIEFKKFDFIDNSQRIIDLDIQPIPDFALAGRANKQDPIEIFKDFIHQNPNKKIAFACLSEGFRDRVNKIFHDYGITCSLVENFHEVKNKSHRANIFILQTNFGFNSSDLIFIGEQAIFGEKITRKKNNKSANLRILEEGLSIALNELVVHRHHGIGRFEGLQTIKTNNINIEMIKISYAGNDSLFVCVDDINLITRYGAENSLVQLDKLGAGNWLNRRNKVRQRIKVTAQELLKVAGERKLKKSPIFVADSNFYDEFKNQFGFIETPDQLSAIEDVENDLRSGMPMDRLICGDVGFGKTEVAMRASAIVCNFAQVAIITPTTLLCRQHYKNFCQRFSQTKIKIVQLSRLNSQSANKNIHQQIANGDAQIIIGTHALLQKNIKFSNLGLVIIDEEQHFGVKQKEFLKQLRSETHILSLSATPIPRTLQMSLSQVKDLSLIATPPLDRLSVRNFVMPFDNTIVYEAVMREFNRGGKVFFVVPRVRDIDEIFKRLKNLLPEIKIAQAHGQMTPIQLDSIMNDFLDGKFDLLISTTIIESGIDISSANTMIIYRAEMFGLAQLYQLRGRVGRGKLRGYCYFMLNNRKIISPEAKKKLEVMQNLDALGIGFTVATHDMDIRGSGNLLSDEQSGHQKDTGIELYQQMLASAIEEIKNNQDFSNNDSDLNSNLNIENNIFLKLGISLLIPQDYIAELSLRMSFYKKISNSKNSLDRENLVNELTDRFGKIPEEVFNLFAVSEIKKTCERIGITSLELGNNSIIIAFKNNNFKNANGLLDLVLKSKGLIKITAQHKLNFSVELTESCHQRISKTQEIIDKLIKLYEQN